jgi:hypothetical protein
MNVTVPRLLQNSSPRHRWNPVYPPGKPGKPHPVDCALSGDAEIDAKAGKKKQKKTKKKQSRQSHAHKTNPM